MKTTKKLCYVSVVALLLSATNLFATLSTGTLTITAPGLSHGDVNGPYDVVSTPATGADLGNFDTFCLAYTVDYYSGGKYDYVVSTDVEPQAGGFGGTGKGYVTLGTAWLYSQYLDNNAALTGKNDAIQEVIWYLQGQSAPTSASGYDTILDLVDTQFGGNVDNNANGEYGIYALNLLIGTGSGYASAAPGDAHGYAQPQLCYIPAPVPEPGTVMAGMLILAPLTASTVRRLRKNKSAIK
ncbi:MAG TPA: hypothetical protein VMV89_05875 [Candidatus Paceibacterota bacterium]|nr:hypothetical protein [Candidatus Paceibacterota bacterium]